MDSAITATDVGNVQIHIDVRAEQDLDSAIDEALQILLARSFSSGRGTDLIRQMKEIPPKGRTLGVFLQRLERAEQMASQLDKTGNTGDQAVAKHLRSAVRGCQIASKDIVFNLVGAQLNNLKQLKSPDTELAQRAKTLQSQFKKLENKYRLHIASEFLNEHAQLMREAVEVAQAVREGIEGAEEVLGAARELVEKLLKKTKESQQKVDNRSLKKIADHQSNSMRKHFLEDLPQFFSETISALETARAQLNQKSLKGFSPDEIMSFASKAIAKWGKFTEENISNYRLVDEAFSRWAKGPKAPKAAGRDRSEAVADED